MNKPIYILFLVIACSSSKPDGEKQIRHGIVPISSKVEQRLTEAQVTRGKILYQEHCLSCHGEVGKGDGPQAGGQKKKPADLQKLASEVKNFLFFMSISQWDRRMPGWEEPFTSQEREELTAYIKTFAHK